MSSHLYRTVLPRLPGETDEEYAAREERLGLARALEHSGIPPRTVQAVLDREYDHDAIAIQHVTRWMATEVAFLLLAGRPGTGKSFAAAVALALCRRGGQLLRASEIARCSLFAADDRLTIESIVETRGVLIIDDLGAEATTSITSSIWDEVFDGRYERGRTVVTSNLTFARIVDRYGSRVGDRLRHRGMLVELPASAKNYREPG